MSEGKTLQGVVSSQQAWEDKGTFVSKFCFHGERVCFCHVTLADGHVNLPVLLLLPVQIERLCSDMSPMQLALEEDGISILMNIGGA